MERVVGSNRKKPGDSLQSSTYSYSPHPQLRPTPSPQEMFVLKNKKCNIKIDMAQQGMKNEKRGGWSFSQFSGAPTVIIAEKKLNWYDEQRMEEIEEEFYLPWRRWIFFDKTENDCNRYSKRRKGTRVEAYRKYNNENFQENIKTFLEALEDLFEEKET